MQEDSDTVKTSRIPFDSYIMRVCHVVASRATCRHREQGAVIVHNKRILSTGYNGAPPGAKDCLEYGYCAKEENLPCRAEGLHAESNAIVTAAREGIRVEGSTLYCIFSPCLSCCNIIKTAGIIEVIYLHTYPYFEEGPGYLELLGVKVRQLEEKW